MRYIILSLLTIYITFSLPAQSIRGGLALGSNLSQVDGDEVWGYKKFGLNASAIALMEFSPKWSLSLEANFNQKGAYQKYPMEADNTKKLPYYNLRLNYAEVPVLMHFTDKEFLTIGLGFAWGRLVGVKEIEWGNQTAVTLNSGEYDIDDYTALVDVKMPIIKSLYFNFRFAYSLNQIRQRTYTDIYGDSWTRKQYNNVLTVRLYYIFNQAKNNQ